MSEILYRLENKESRSGPFSEANNLIDPDDFLIISKRINPIRDDVSIFEPGIHKCAFDSFEKTFEIFENIFQYLDENWVIAEYEISDKYYINMYTHQACFDKDYAKLINELPIK